MSKLFTSSNEDSLESLVKEEMLTRSEFGFYEKILPIDTVQDIISSLNFLFDIPYWMIILGIPFTTKALITIPIHIYQQRKYEQRLSTLPIAVYEINKVTHKERLSRKRGGDTTDYDYDQHILSRKQIHDKYGYNVSKTQLLPYIAAMVQIPIHLTMFVSLRTINTRYPLWSEGGPNLSIIDFANLSNLSITDNSMILPLSIGCTMGILQYMMYRRNITRSAGFNTQSLKYINCFATVIITYLSINWSIGFNLYILSNLSSYIVQQTLMDSNSFRNIVGLNKYNKLQPDIRKLQIIYECMRLSMKQNVNLRQEYIEKGGDNKNSYNVLPQFQNTWIHLLQNTQNFNKLNAKKEELQSILNDIATVDNIQIQFDDDDDNDNDDNDEGVYGNSDGKQYSFQFTDREELENRRKQIQETIKNSTMRSFLLKQKKSNQPNNNHHDIDYEEHQVRIQDIDGDNKKNK